MSDRARKPRTVRKELFATEAWQTTLQQLARDSGRSEGQVQRDARRYLNELLPGASNLSNNILIRFGRFVYTRGYDRDIQVDERQINEIRERARKHPITFVSNHRSQVDSFAIFCALHDNDLPHPVTFGGINMKIPVMGNILKNGGLVFIRRAFQDNPVYKAVLRAYIDYLVEHGLPLFWAIEGTRSRTGKLVPPRFGLMNWVLDAHERMSERDMLIVPIAASYDQIADVSSYSEQERGGAKKPEDFKWLVHYLRGFKQPLGPITVHFGKPVSVREHVAAFEATHPESRGSRKSAVPSIVVAACNRMDDVTPVTCPSLIAMMLLGANPHALMASELSGKFCHLVDNVRRHGWPTTFDAKGDLDAILKQTLDSLVAGGVLDQHDAGYERVYSVARDKELYASYYRNNSIHFFVPGAIAELALIAASADASNTTPDERVAAHAWRLRDLLRYEFYFLPRDEFIASVIDDLDTRAPGWRESVAAGSEDAWARLSGMTPMLSHKVLPSFLEAYQIVASELERISDNEFDRASFIKSCIGTGEQLYRLGRISNRESIAKAMFETGILVTRNVSGESFAAELEQQLATLVRVRSIAAARGS
jgi:glycerol-3-phosphate O-acyltransferase